MRTNNLLTFLLYALLLGLILVGGYKACQMRNDKAELAKQAEAMKQWDDMRHVEPDSAAPGGSSFVSKDSSLGTSKPGSTPEGIEDEPVSTPKTTAAPVSTTPKQEVAKTEAPKPEPAKTSTAAGSKTTTAKTGSISAGSTAPKSVKGLGTGRYSVRVGSFSDVDRARNQLEKVIKLGFLNAEINKINNGKLSTVVVFRSNDKAAATKIVDQLKAKSVEALIHDSQKK
jgi:cell division protein FtsN